MLHLILLSKLDVVIMRETTCGIDIKNAPKKALTRANVPPSKLVSVATDGAPAMKVNLLVNWTE